MKDLWRKYYIHFILVGLVVAVGVVAIGFYINEFGANGLSGKTGDWANFATYISGTVGVAAVVATLIAFVITLKQQKKLIDSQDDMLINSYKQLRLSEEQNNWVIGYECYKRFLPIHLNACRDDRSFSIVERLRLNGFIEDSDFFELLSVGKLFDDYSFSNLIDSSFLVSVECLEYIRINYMDKRFGLALVASKCIDSSDILRPLVMGRLAEDDFMKSIYCVLAYRSSVDEKRVAKIEDSFGITLESYVKASSAVAWWKVQGDRVASYKE